MGLGEIINKSIEDYRTNFKSLMKLVLVFLGIPLVITSLIGSYLLFKTGFFEILPQLMTGDKSGLVEFYQNISGYVWINWVLSLFVLLFSIAVTVAIISASLKKEKFLYSDLIKGIKENYLRVLILLVLMALIFAVLFGIFALPLIVLMYKPLDAISSLLMALVSLVAFAEIVILGIYWMFSIYLVIDKKTRVLKSFGESRRFVKGRWWKAIFYAIIVVLTLGLILWALGLPNVLLNKIFESRMLEGISGAGLICYVLLLAIFSSLKNVLLTPFSALLFKNFYLDFKGKEKKR